MYDFLWYCRTLVVSSTAGGYIVYCCIYGGNLGVIHSYIEGNHAHLVILLYPVPGVHQITYTTLYLGALFVWSHVPPPPEATARRNTAAVQSTAVVVFYHNNVM